MTDHEWHDEWISGGIEKTCKRCGLIAKHSKAGVYFIRKVGPASFDWLDDTEDCDYEIVRAVINE